MLMNVLRELLRARGLRNRDIAERLNIAERTVSRWLSNDKIDASLIESLCGLLNITFFELCELASQRVEDRISRLTIQQEQVLAEDDLLLYVFRQLLKGWTTEEIRVDLEIPESALIDALIRLQKIDLIELLPRNQVRLRTVRNIKWLPKGPCSRSANEWLGRAFEDADVSDSQSVWAFDEVKLSEASCAQLRPKFERLLEEIRELSNDDRRLNPDARRWYACILAIHPSQLLPYTRWPAPSRGWTRRRRTAA